MSPMAEVTARDVALRAGVKLEILTVVWMAAEAAIAIGAGIVARSVLLTAFGADSVIELLSGATLLWRLWTEERGGELAALDAVERPAVRISAVLLILLSIYVAVTAVAGLLFRVEPEPSWLGIGVAAAAVVVMPVLAHRKRAANKAIQSPALRADIAESIACAYLAGVTLIGVMVDALTGWWWIEYVAAIVLLRWIVPEAREALESARDTAGAK